jgi:CubicO group peptidase (beta-lactamase class C family)
MRYFHSAVAMVSVILLTACGHVPKMIWKNFPTVRDLGPEAPISASHRPWYFETEVRDFPAVEQWVWRSPEDMPASPEAFFQKSGTDAFLVVRGDSIIMEYYSPKYNRSTRFNPHSVSKAVVSLLTGIAWDKGYIRSIDQPVTDYLPELKGQVSSDLRIRDLLQMTSGLNFKEQYLNPFSSVNRMYFGRNTQKEMKRIRQQTSPGTRFTYASSNTWLLVRVLERATGSSLSEFTHKALWEPLGVPADAGWMVDKPGGLAKGFDGFNTTAAGMARLGQLIANKGTWKGATILPENWITHYFAIDTIRASRSFYQMGWFPDRYYPDLLAEGIFYQYLYVHPESKTVIVRIGKLADRNYDWRLSFRALSGLYPRPSIFKQDSMMHTLQEGIYRMGAQQDGDSTLAGKQVQIRYGKSGIEVQTIKWGSQKAQRRPKPFLLLPESEYRWFDPCSDRKMEFNPTTGKLYWIRRENTWDLNPQ